MKSVLIFYRLRGFLAVFDLAQIINLVWTSFKTQYVAINKWDLCNTQIAIVYSGGHLVTFENGLNLQTSSILCISE